MNQEYDTCLVVWQRLEWLGSVMIASPNTLARSIEDKSNVSATLQLSSSVSFDFSLVDPASAFTCLVFSWTSWIVKDAPVLRRADLTRNFRRGCHQLYGCCNLCPWLLVD